MKKIEIIVPDNYSDKNLIIYKCAYYNRGILKREYVRLYSPKEVLNDIKVDIPDCYNNLKDSIND